MSPKKLFSVLLAAGSGQRFGATKQLALYEGQPLVTRAMRTAESVCHSNSIVVVGKDWREVTKSSAPMQGFYVQNPHYADGIAGSIRAGIRCVADCADGVLLLLADQPLVTGAHLAALEQVWRDSTDSIVASGYADTEGPPIIFPRADFPALLSLTGDRGARSVVAANPERLKTVMFEEGANDIDLPEDLQHL